LFTVKSEDAGGGQETRAQLFIVRRGTRKKRLGEMKMGRKGRKRRNGGHYSVEEGEGTFYLGGYPGPVFSAL